MFNLISTGIYSTIYALTRYLEQFKAARPDPQTIISSRHAEHSQEEVKEGEEEEEEKKSAENKIVELC